MNLLDFLWLRTRISEPDGSKMHQSHGDAFKLKVTFLDLFAGIWAHSLQSTELASLLDDESYEVQVLRCEGFFENHCAVNEARKRDFLGDKSKFDCFDCTFSSKANSAFLSKRLGKQFSYLKLSEIFQNQSETLFSSISKTLVSHSIDQEILGINPYKLAMYETILKFKKNSIVLVDDDQKAFFELTYSNAIKATIVAHEYFNKNKIDVLVIHSPQYSINNCFAQMAELFGVTVYYVDGSTCIPERYSAVHIWDWSEHGFMNPLRDIWPDFEGTLEATAQQSQKVFSHFEEIRSARSFSVYAAGGTSEISIYERFDIPRTKKIFLLTVSSVDEALAANIIGAHSHEKFLSTVYRNQFDWVRATIKWFSERQTLSLVIRLHPRDMRTNRSNLQAGSSKAWMELLDVLPENVKLDHPDMRIPIIDYFEVVTGLITGWSSTILEALFYNVPVITYDKKILNQPQELVLTGTSESEYFSNLDKVSSDVAVQKDWKNDVIKWLSANFNEGTIGLSGRLFEKRRLKFPRVLELILNGLDRYFFFVIRPLELMLLKRRQESKEKFKKLISNRDKNLFSSRFKIDS